jgi:RimJ/RimL family protein N-acetyltransferase
VDRPLLDIAVLGPGDEPELERFLSQHADSSMFLRANLYHAGIVDTGERLHGTYVAARDRRGIVAVAAHWWNGLVGVQGAVDAVGDVARVAAERSGRAVAGFTGPWAQVVAARAALGLGDRKGAFDSRDDLFALALDDLRVPPQLADGTWQSRRATAGDVDELARWRFAYHVDLLGATPSPEVEARARGEVERDPTGWWVLVVDGAVVSTTTFNAQLPDCVQVGGVYTPPALRGRGYARAVVAASLLEARAAGATRSILFTGADNAAARAAYLALGYQIVGDYGLVMF